MSDKMPTDTLPLTAEIVSAYVANNEIPVEAVPSLLQSLCHSLTTVGEVEVKLETRAPAGPVKKSVFPEYIVCLEAGKKMKMLKRHLKTSYNMTSDDYRTKWGLPRDDPMVAPIYAAHRSTLAKKIGLGMKRVGEPAVEKLPARRAKGSRG